MSPALLDLPLWMVVLLPLAKILATSISIGSGGSGDVFGPGLVIGGLAGGTFWRLAHQILPAMTDGPAAFVVVGMVALFGSVAHAPLGMIVMVSEMTGNLGLIVPAAVAVSLAQVLVGSATSFHGQRLDRTTTPDED
jgi:CIC family chloride channel protein